MNNRNKMNNDMREMKTKYKKIKWLLHRINLNKLSQLNRKLFLKPLKILFLQLKH